MIDLGDEEILERMLALNPEQVAYRTRRCQGGFANRRRFFAILICFILLAVTYGLAAPPFENLDEIEHFEAIRCKGAK